ncbi:TetR/AcrR family transcriptional regulator [Antrihabitans cavernicola]|uniref:TetR/AcrR family transcriptional regulator n=1 Tax=Antrihabitans cavernicola TaxID=2495913 RepID=A0A5A7S736_9NOCA|nr:TetR/AcrR family transcriptional regulator [Spelaeibacter cavernicola]KAA0021968.1 TetR/AcrR family transcriptional regulator [Spelaeibacter cavernicola]
MSTPRRRLDPEQRREQLLDIGARLFGERPYEEVLIEEVAELAAVSRGLMYHYFPNKRDFFAAIVQRSAEQLLAATEIDPDLPMAEQISSGLDAFIGHTVKNQYGVLAINRGALSGDPAIQKVVDWEQGILRDRILDALGVSGHSHDVASAAVLGWLGFTRAVCTDWVENQAMSREELRDLCVRALVGALGSATRLDELPH